MVGDETILKQIGAAIRKRREELGYSQEKLAELSGVDRSFICGVERGINNISLITLCEIIHAMNIKFVNFICELKSNK